MPDSIRQQLVDAVEARLKSIATFGGRVYPWRRTDLNPSEMPCVLLFDRTAEVGYEGVEMGKAEHRLRLELEAYGRGATTAVQARAMLAEIVAAIWQDPRWGGLARWTTIDSHELALEHADQIVGGILLNITIVYRAPLGSM